MFRRLLCFFIPIWLRRKIVNAYYHRAVSFGLDAFATKDCVLEIPCEFQENTKIYNSFIGRFSYVAHDSFVSNSDIGRFCSIGPNVTIGPGKHPTDNVSTSPFFYANNIFNKYSLFQKKMFEETARVKIGADVWIGAGAIVLDGIEVGHGAIVAAGSVVTKNIPPYQIYGGVPAKFMRSRFDGETIKKLLELEWWNKDLDWIQRYGDLFSSIACLDSLN